MKVLIVDDEQMARDELRCLLEREGDIEVLSEAANAIEAIAAVNRLAPEVVFLDIQMPRVSGFEMLSMLDPDRMPRIVFVTAHDEYAVRAFEEHAFDYVLKPADPARLAKTLQHLRRDCAPQNLSVLTGNERLRQIPCAGQNRIYLVKLDEVEYVASKPAGVYVVAGDAPERFTELTLRTLEERTALLRCHRQYLVNPDRIREIRFADNGVAEIVTAAARTVPVSRRYLGLLKERLGFG
jgi:two-component system, LytTR family, response regulator